MMTELMLVEGVTDIQLISYYLQKVYGWTYVKSNNLGIVPLDEHDHIESLSRGDNQLVLCGVGGNSRFTHFIEQHRINSMIVERDIASLMIVTDRDDGSVGEIVRKINALFKGISIKAGKWTHNTIIDSFKQEKYMDTYLMIVPAEKTGALERVIIDALEDIPTESPLINEVVQFVNSLEYDIAPMLKQKNNADKATVGTFFSIREPKNAMRSFAAFISKIDWTKSNTLNELFLPFKCLGEKK
jgi:hypothetical protein